MSPVSFNFASAQGTTWAQGGTWSFSATRRQLTLLFVCMAMALTLVAPFAGAGQRGVVPTTASHEFVQVFVRGAEGAGDAVQQAVTAAGGTLEESLEGLNAFVAQVPEDAIDGLRKAGGVLTVAPNAPIELYSEEMTGDALRGGGSMDFIRKITGANVLDKMGYDGTGIGVAVIDSGVSPVPGLDGPGKLFHGPDVSFDGTMNPDVAHLDEYGHGTHIAGIIGGSDPQTSGGGSTSSTSGIRFQGIAETSKIINVKAASATGDTDLLQILAAIDWVVQHKADQNIRVLNLSFGIANPGDYRTDALAWAVERAWKAGIVVVVAAGNEGDKPGSAISSPATDPYVIAVGSADNKTTEDLSDDTVSTFSPLGTADRRVDMVAPAQSDISLRVPGSYSDTMYPAARVGDRFFKGTGTSQAAAVVSGAVADLLEQRPTLTPDQVKAILKASAKPLPAADPIGQGAGLVCVKCALRQATPTTTQNFESANVDGPNVGAPPEPAEAGVTGGSWTGGSWTGGSWTGGSWTGGSWTGNVWSGGSWTGGSWTGGSWTGDSWSGGSWTGGSWTGGSWTGGSWTGGSWTGGSWTGGSWTGGSWTGGSWTGGSWTGGSWTGGSWTGGSWTGGSWTGGSWTGGSWTGGSWTGGSWTGGSWTGGSWTGGSWTGGSWTGGSWTGGSWTGGSWTGGSWTGGSWTGGSWTNEVWTGGTWT